MCAIVAFNYLFPVVYVFCIVFYYVNGRRICNLLRSPILENLTSNQANKFFSILLAWVVLQMLPLYYSHFDAIFNTNNFGLRNAMHLIGSFVHFHQYTFHWLVIGYVQYNSYQKIQLLDLRAKQPNCNLLQILFELRELSQLTMLLFKSLPCL